MRLAPEIAAAHPRVAGLQLGLADLFESMHADRRDPANVHAAMFQMSMACAESGKFACDSAYPDVADAAGFRREAEQARKLGYVGKSCVHPQQVALANEAFGAATLDPDTARRIVAAAKDAAQAVRGAFLLDGRMIDLSRSSLRQGVRVAAAALADGAGHAVEQFSFGEGLAQPFVCLEGGRTLAVVTRRDPYDRNVTSVELLRQRGGAA